MHILALKLAAVGAAWLIFLLPSGSSAATMSITPAAGTFVVGSTFNISIYLNTEKQSVNTIGAALSFPADRLQLVSPSTGSSIISLWTTLPNVDNQNGKVVLQGGIPGGINLSNGLIMTLTFRVKSVGPALLRFSDASRVLLNDGHGTDALNQTSNAIYNLILPPPAGPIVVSESHPDQSRWYQSPTVVLRWHSDDLAGGYSYVINGEPIDFPDDISEGARRSVTYQSLKDGIHYFHIKALKEIIWGGATHFAVKIDSTAPASFPIEIAPRARATYRLPIFNFATTDALSGIDHYELKLITLKLNSPGKKSPADFAQPLFIEAASPYIPGELALGSYDVIVRAYDQAQNYKEVKKRLEIVTPFLSVADQAGLQIGGALTVPWVVILPIILLAILILGFLAWRVRRWHHQATISQTQKKLPPNIESELALLQKYRQKYGLLVALLAFLPLLWLLTSPASASEVNVPPPIVSTVSENITNEQIFYAGGRVAIPLSSVILYLQNLSTGETISDIIKSDKSGEWFYSHPKFLHAGNYLLWAQGKVGEELSPPSPQIKLKINTSGLQLGSSNISFELIYLVLFIISCLIILFLLGYIVIHWYFGQKRHQLILAEILEAEESVRRGFAVLRRDIESEIEALNKIKLSKELSQAEQDREKHLLSDLDDIEKKIGKEIWDIEMAEEK